MQIKRIYEQATESDGFRVLVDRVWPRGVTKIDAKLDEWLKDVAPSAELRKWYGHDPAKFGDFQKRYLIELETNPAMDTLREFLTEHKQVTLLFAAHDPESSQAAVLRDYLETIS